MSIHSFTDPINKPQTFLNQLVGRPDRPKTSYQALQTIVQEIFPDESLAPFDSLQSLAAKAQNAFSFPLNHLNLHQTDQSKLTLDLIVLIAFIFAHYGPKPQGQLSYGSSLTLMENNTSIYTINSSRNSSGALIAYPLIDSRFQPTIAIVSRKILAAGACMAVFKGFILSGEAVVLKLFTNQRNQSNDFEYWLNATDEMVISLQDVRGKVPTYGASPIWCKNSLSKIFLEPYFPYTFESILGEAWTLTFIGRISYKLIKALASLHQAGYAHNDLKMDNIVVRKEEKNAYVHLKIKLIDCTLGYETHKNSVRLAANQKKDCCCIINIIIMLIININGRDPITENIDRAIAEMKILRMSEPHREAWHRIFTGLVSSDPNMRLTADQALELAYPLVPHKRARSFSPAENPILNLSVDK